MVKFDESSLYNSSSIQTFAERANLNVAKYEHYNLELDKIDMLVTDELKELECSLYSE